MLRSQAHSGSGRTDRLGISRPDFLNLLDDAPEAAFSGLYAFARDLMRVCPPSALRGLDPDRRQDVLHDLVLHCCKDDFRVLRRYRDRGRPFAAWLQLVARNRYLDTVRRERRSAAVSLDGDPDGEPLQVPDPNAAACADDAVDRNTLIAKVRQALSALSEKCRLLVQGAADGYKPRELVKLLGWPPDWNKKASDDLRECRRRLRRELEASSVDLGSLT